jgi:hypothetical protein
MKVIIEINCLPVRISFVITRQRVIHGTGIKVIRVTIQGIYSWLPDWTQGMQMNAVLLELCRQAG